MKLREEKCHQQEPAGGADRRGARENRGGSPDEGSLATDRESQIMTGGRTEEEISSRRANLLEDELVAVERFRVAARSIALHAAEPHEGEKRIFLKPPLGALGLEGFEEVLDFLLTDT
jgi:hypothetical protein